MSQRSRNRSRSRERERERERYKQRQTQRQRERDRERQRDSNRDRDRERERQRDMERERKRSWSPEDREYNRTEAARPQRQTYSKDYKQTKKEQRKQQQKPQQQTKVLCIEEIPSHYLHQLERKMTDTSISVGTSVPDEVQIKDGMAYIKYPSIQVASQIFNYLKGNLLLQEKQFKLKYWPIKHSDINILYDWYCDKCEYKNFAKRGKCHQCDNQKNPTCRLNYGSQFVSFNTNKREEIDDSVNCSLMIRGPIITQVQEEVLLNLFQAFAPIKDIRMIRNKVTGGNKDFAFIEFFTPEEAAFALKKTNTPSFSVLGQKVTVMYSKTKQDDQFFARPYDKDRRGPPPPRRQTRISEDTPNYYLRQRQLEIQEEKKRPLITLQQLKEKRQIEMRKTLPQQKQMSQEQNQRRKAQMLAKQWEKQLKMQLSQIFICSLCKRKFRTQEEMKDHSRSSDLHKYKLAKAEKELLSL